MQCLKSSAGRERGTRAAIARVCAVGPLIRGCATSVPNLAYSISSIRVNVVLVMGLKPIAHTYARSMGFCVIWVWVVCVLSVKA